MVGYRHHYCPLRKRLTATVDENLASTHIGVVTSPSFRRGVTARKIVSTSVTCTAPRGDPHQLRHWTRTLTRAWPGSVRVGVPARRSRSTSMRSVKVGRTWRPSVTDT